MAVQKLVVIIKGTLLMVTTYKKKKKVIDMDITEKQERLLLMAKQHGITLLQAMKVYSSGAHAEEVLKHLQQQGMLRPNYGWWKLTEKGKEHLNKEKTEAEKTWIVISNLQKRVAELEKNIETLLMKKNL